MNDIRPPRPRSPRPLSISPRPVSSPPSPSLPPPAVTATTPPLQLDMSHLPPVDLPPQPSKKPKRSLGKVIFLVVCGLILLLAVVAAAAGIWYKTQLAAVSTTPNAAHIRVTIDEGMGPVSIAERLETSKVIKSALAFRLYTKLHGSEDKLQAGVYNLSPNASTPDIVGSLTSGKVDTISITFLPGATVADDKKVLLKAGYTEAEVDAAFAKRYDHPVLTGKPASADLEGYIYGETYQFSSSATVEEILMRTFDELYGVVKEDNLVAGFKAQGLSLYQGITLASIVQREVNTSADQRQVAQVFLLRLKEGIPLGSDVTYQYAADKMGVARDPGLDSPYNTRIVKGLPPGPISAPGRSALDAVANPAPGDYLFFLSGDDDKTYFAHTQAEHEQNIVNHCQKKCQIL